MTTDAKVGLLLGLVFIVIIAFVINGLPDFVGKFKDKPAVVETAVTTQTGGNLVIEPAVVDVARSLQQGRTNNLRYVDSPSESDAAESLSGESQTTENVAGAAESQNTLATSDSQANATLAQPQTQEGQPQAELLSPQLTQTQRAAQTTVSQVETAVTPQPKTAAVQTATISGKTHIVTEGESLASIAKKYYGPEFGNQRAIIEAIYKANKSVLDSPNKVRIGDKLIIPTLAQEQKKPAVEEKTESKSLMDKFKDVFVSTEKKAETAAKPGESEDKPAADSDSTKTTVKKPQAVAKTNISDDKPAIIVSEKKISDKKPAVVTKTNPVENKPLASVSSKKAADVSAVTEKKNKPEPKVQGVSYTIQSGDNPYKIAEKLLGDGNRYPEILALNRDRIKNPSKLVVGTQIIVPKR